MFNPPDEEPKEETQDNEPRLELNINGDEIEVYEYSNENVWQIMDY